MINARDIARACKHWIFWSAEPENVNDCSNLGVRAREGRCLADIEFGSREPTLGGNQRRWKSDQCTGALTELCVVASRDMELRWRFVLQVQWLISQFITQLRPDGGRGTAAVFDIRRSPRCETWAQGQYVSLPVWLQKYNYVGSWL